MNIWRLKALAAVAAYRTGIGYKQYPAPGTVGYCARFARALWSDVHGKPCPYGQRDGDKDGDVDALDMRFLVKQAGRLITGNPNANAYHVAAAKGYVKPGAFLFFPYSRYGHVAVVVDITGTPATDLRHVLCAENTSSGRNDGRTGTRLTRLDYICGALGSGRIDGVGTV